MIETASNPTQPLLSRVSRAELNRLKIKARRNASSDLLGNYRSAFRGSGLSQKDLREYTPGDDIRHIHWKATARCAKPFVKTYEEERTLTIMLVRDISRSMMAAGTDAGIITANEFCSLISLLALNSGDAVGICDYAETYERYIPSRRGRNQFNAVISMLTGDLSNSTDRKIKTDLSSTIDFVASRQRRGSVIFIISDFFSPDFDSQLTRLASRHDIIGVYIEPKIFRTIPNAGIVEFLDPESGQTALVDTSSKLVRSAILAKAQTRRTQLTQTFKSAGADFISIGDNLTQPLIRLMSDRTVRH